MFRSAGEYADKIFGMIMLKKHQRVCCCQSNGTFWCITQIDQGEGLESLRMHLTPLRDKDGRSKGYLVFQIFQTNLFALWWVFNCKLIWKSKMPQQVVLCLTTACPYTNFGSNIEVHLITIYELSQVYITILSTCAYADASEGRWLSAELCHGDCKRR